jgi:N-acetylmuramoyl-L-alanine amidase
MKRIRQLLATVFLFFPLLSAAAPVSVHNLRLWQAPDNTRLVFDLSGPLEHRLSTLSNPDRIVIELSNARLQDGLAALDVSHSYISAVHATELVGGNLRITLELKRPVRPKTFVLRPAGQYGHRLVIDLYDEVIAKAAPNPEPRAAPPVRQALAPSDLIVAIDAGHGGEDPGAIGRRYHTREKDVTLAIARELYKLIAATPGMKPVMIRDGDYYVGLRNRTEKAKNNDAEVFVSIHADAVPGRQARGSSVYALSLRGASSEQVRVLADKENAADLIGGADFSEADSVTKKVMVDMVQSVAIEDSIVLGSDVLSSLHGIGSVHHVKVQQAGFMVLKSPKFPSILVETAFISNPDEEQKLRDRNYQRNIAESILKGLKRAMPRLIARRSGDGESLRAAAPASPPVTSAVQSAQAAPIPSAREHIVKPGETLSAIARLYDIHVETLRFLNGIQGDDLTVGTKLLVPMRGSAL